MRSSLNYNSLKTIRERYDELKKAEPRLRARDAAEKLCCTEAELIAAGCGVEWVWHLDASSLMKWLPLVAELPGWMWLLRNDAAVLEKDAVGTRLVSSNGHHRFEGNGFCVELENSEIGYVFYASFSDRLPRVLQIFDHKGNAVLKLYLKNKGVAEKADATIRLFKEDAPEHLDVVEGFSAGDATDLSDARELPVGSYGDLIQWAADSGESIALTARNNGGEMRVFLVPERIKLMPDWFNILDRGFNLHLMEPLISRAACTGLNGRFDARYFKDNGTELLSINMPSESLATL